jgi:hypothetical protein
LVCAATLSTAHNHRRNKSNPRLIGTNLAVEFLNRQGVIEKT